MATRSSEVPDRTGGRVGVRRLLAALAIVAAASAGVVAASDTDQRIAVQEDGGVYTVSATFAVPQSPAVVLMVLSDYERIPRFMPAVRSSIVLERGQDWALIEQEAIARFMMFSKRVHLILDVEDHPGAIRFNDRCGKSFARYSGSWTMSGHDGMTSVTYALTAKPSFDVPEVLLKHLLKRDAGEMITRLKEEIATRSLASER